MSLTVRWTREVHDPIPVQTREARPGSREQVLVIVNGWTYPPPKPPKPPRKLATVIPLHRPKEIA